MVNPKETNWMWYSRPIPGSGNWCVKNSTSLADKPVRACFLSTNMSTSCRNLLTEIALTKHTWPFKSLLSPNLTGKRTGPKCLKEPSGKGEVYVCERGDKGVFSHRPKEITILTIHTWPVSHYRRHLLWRTWFLWGWQWRYELQKRDGLQRIHLMQN